MKYLVALFVALSFCIAPVTSFAADDAPKCIDVEKASAKDLQKAKGIGEKIAKAIIDYRKKNRAANTKAKKKTWNFNNWATVMKVSGVGPKICADNINVICFSGKLQKACPKKK